MAIAQQLYEGIDISGEGTVGLITYMRTDSLRLSDEALAAAMILFRRAMVQSIIRLRPVIIKPRLAPRMPMKRFAPAM